MAVRVGRAILLAVRGLWQVLGPVLADVTERCLGECGRIPCGQDFAVRPLFEQGLRLVMHELAEKLPTERGVGASVENERVPTRVDLRGRRQRTDVRCGTEVEIPQRVLEEQLGLVLSQVVVSHEASDDFLVLVGEHFLDGKHLGCDVLSFDVFC